MGLSQGKREPRGSRELTVALLDAVEEIERDPGSRAVSAVFDPPWTLTEIQLTLLQWINILSWTRSTVEEAFGQYVPSDSLAGDMFDAAFGDDEDLVLASAAPIAELDDQQLWQLLIGVAYAVREVLADAGGVREFYYFEWLHRDAAGAVGAFEHDEMLRAVRPCALVTAAIVAGNIEQARAWCAFAWYYLGDGPLLLHWWAAMRPFAGKQLKGFMLVNEGKPEQYITADAAAADPGMWRIHLVARLLSASAENDLDSVVDEIGALPSEDRLALTWEAALNTGTQLGQARSTEAADQNR